VDISIDLEERAIPELRDEVHDEGALWASGVK